MFVDIIGYRKYGHNEQDLPDFTQPVLYKKVRSMKPINETYGEQLIAEGIITKEKINEMEEKYMEFFKAEHELGKKGEYDMTVGDFYKDLNEITKLDGKTAIDEKLFYQLGKTLHTIPDSYKAHDYIKKTYAERLKGFDKEGKISWYAAESLAFASILKDGFKVRMSGQDVRSGTFQRNLFIQNQEDSNANCLVSDHFD